MRRGGLIVNDLRACREKASSATLNRRQLLSALGAFLAAECLLAPAARAQTLAAITGVWQGQEASPLGLMGVEAIFFPNGAYRRTHVMGQLMTWDSGDFSVVQNWIHFRLQNYGPTRYRGQELQRPASDTWVVHHFDGQSLQATVGGNSTVTVRRTG